MRKPEKQLIGLVYYEGGTPYAWEPAEYEANGLAVHRMPRRRGKWKISHIASGLAVAPVVYYSRESALMALGRLTMFLDWTDPSSNAHATAADAERVRRRG